MKSSSIDQIQKSFSKQLKNSQQKIAVAVRDPLMGTTAIHGLTNKRPKAYAGEHIPCPWDTISNPILQSGSACLVINDYPALSSPEVLHQSFNSHNLYSVSTALGSCYVVIYSHHHDGHWLTLSRQEQNDVVDLWGKATQMVKQKKSFSHTHIFENDGPLNTMTHPHGQQYALVSLPPQTQEELDRCALYYRDHGMSMFNAITDAELQGKERLIVENTSFFAYAPPGARWPFQVRILPKDNVLWIDELSDQGKQDLAHIITMIRFIYSKYFSQHYRPTIMMNVFQAPFDRSASEYRRMYRMRVEFFVTALSSTAEKLMFSIENSTGYSLYSQTPEETARLLKSFLQ